MTHLLTLIVVLPLVGAVLNGLLATRLRGAPYGSDLRLYNAEGIPSLHLGPGEVRYAHGPLEQVRLSEVAAVARSLVLTILRTCGTR